MIRKENTRRLYADIRTAYDDLSKEVEFGARKYTDDYIIKRLAHRFYKSVRTIQNIVYRN